MRATFAIWIERWLNDVGIPARANLVGFNVIVDNLFSDTVQEDLDMWMLGWSLSLFPDYVEAFFNSRHAPENEEGGYNWGGYANPEFDDLSFSLLSETSVESAREKVFSKYSNTLPKTFPMFHYSRFPSWTHTGRPGLTIPYITVLGGVEGANGMQTIAEIK